MAKLRVVGLPREASKTGKPMQDGKLLAKIGEKLSSRGHLFHVQAPEELAQLHEKKPQIIVSMARTSESLLALSQLNAQGIKIINEPEAVYRCADLLKLYGKMEAAGIPFPSTRLMSLEDLSYRGEPVILKKPHEYGLRDSTFLIDTAPKMERAKTLVEEEGNRVVLVRPFIEGEPHKAYVVGDNTWLPDFPYKEVSESSLAQEVKESVLALGQKIAGLAFFGVDFLLIKNKTFLITALNDFPSYGQIIEDAVDKIVKHIESM